MNDRDAGKLEGLRYAESIVANRRVGSKTPDYLAALDDMEIFLRAAIERVENGETMNATAIAQ